MTEQTAAHTPGPMQAHPMVFMLDEREGVLFDPLGKFHGWIMRQHPDGMWVSVRKLDAIDPEDNPISRLFTLNTPPPMAMLCDIKADGSCASVGSDFCEYECPNRAISRAEGRTEPKAGE